ncbi:MAG: hypothetical protein JJ913_01935 [Rhizobiaceae bacterium]|nr:hypothetical protein [Rhizobiaceae bacterium]
MAIGNRGRAGVPEFPRETFGEDSVVTRVRRGLAEAGLDCECRETADAILERIGKDGDRATRDAALGDARKMRDAILIVSALLGELDELTVDEPDKSVFYELAALFGDLSDFAARGAESALRAAGPRSSAH